MTKLRQVPDFRDYKKRDLLLLRDEPVFLDPQLLDFRVQRRAGNSEFAAAPSGLQFSLYFPQEPFKNFSLLILESVWQRPC